MRFSAKTTFSGYRVLGIASSALKTDGYCDVLSPSAAVRRNPPRKLCRVQYVRARRIQALAPVQRRRRRAPETR